MIQFCIHSHNAVLQSFTECSMVWMSLSGPLSGGQNDCQHQCRREVCHSISGGPQPAAEETLGPSAQRILPTETSMSSITS